MELGRDSSSMLTARQVPHFADPLTFDEKEALSDDIIAPMDKLAHVVKIVQE